MTLRISYLLLVLAMQLTCWNKLNVLYSMPAAGKLSVGDSVPAAAKLA